MGVPPGGDPMLSPWWVCCECMACGICNLVTPCVDFLLLPTPSVRSLTAALGSLWPLSSSTGGEWGALAAQMGGEQGHPAPAPGNPESLIPSLSGSQHELAQFYVASPILASKQFLSPCIFSVVFLGLLGGVQSQGFMQAISTGLYGSGIAPETEQVLNK